MKIVNKPKCKTFGDLNIGDVFEFDTSYYMRIGNVTTAHGVFNAVSLVSAYACYLADEIKIQKVDAVVVSTEKWNRRAVQIEHGGGGGHGGGMTR